MRYSLGMASWLSYKPRETSQALGEFRAAIISIKQCDPTRHSLTAFEKALDLAQESLTLFQELGTRTAWPYWRPPTSRREDRREMTDLFREICAMAGLGREATITASTMQQGLQRHGLHEFTSPTPDPSDRATFIESACDELNRMEQRAHIAETHSNAAHTHYNQLRPQSLSHSPPRQGMTHNEAHKRTPRSDRSGGSRTSPSVKGAEGGREGGGGRTCGQPR